MNKWILGGIAIVLSIMGANAQTLSVSYDDKDNGFELLTEKPHEVKLNLLSSTIMLHPEIAYDYTINTDMSVGARTSFSLKKDNNFYRTVAGDFQLSPYFRWHFYKNTRGNAIRGFYVEGNIAYTHIGHKEEYVSPDGNRQGYPSIGNYGQVVFTDANINELGLGVGAGYRWITKGAWSFELGATIGRNLLGQSPSEGYSNLIFSIGKRF